MDQYHIRGEDNLKGLADPPRQTLFSASSEIPHLIKLGLPFMKRPQPAMVPYKAGHRDPTLRVRSQARQLAPHSHSFSFSLSLSSKPILFLTPHQLTSPQLTAKYSPLFLESQKPPLYLSTFISQSFQPQAGCCSGISLTALKRIIFAGVGGMWRPEGCLHERKPQV